MSRHAVERPGAPALETTDGSSLDYATLQRHAVEWAAVLAARGVGRQTRVLLAADKGPGWVAAHLGLLALGAVTVPVDAASTEAELADTLALVQPALALADASALPALERAVAISGSSCRPWSLDPRRGAPPDAGAPPGAGALPNAGATPSARALPNVGATPGAGALHDVGAPTVGPPVARPLPAPSDLAALLTTSGTTGRPKAVMLTHRNLSAGVDSLLAAWELVTTDRLLHVLPLFHVHGLFVALHATLAAGGCVRLAPRFDTRATWEQLADPAISAFMGVPTMYHRLIASPPEPPARLDHLRLCTCGSAPLPAETLAAFQRLTGQRILERYGLTEAGMVSGNPLHGERRAGTVGFDLPGVTTRLGHPDTGARVPHGEEGEVQVRGPAVFAGYLDHPDATRTAFSEDGWLRTGDLGRRDEAGALVIAGRLKELVISGGHNVHPAEVEVALAEHPSVSEVGVCGLPDDDLGERVAAAVVWMPGAAADVDGLLAHCRQRLARYKCPRTVVTVDALPRNALGKLQRRELARRIAAHG